MHTQVVVPMSKLTPNMRSRVSPSSQSTRYSPTSVAVTFDPFAERLRDPGEHLPVVVAGVAGLLDASITRRRCERWSSSEGGGSSRKSLTTFGSSEHEPSDPHRGGLRHLHQPRHIHRHRAVDRALAGQPPAVLELVGQVPVVGEGQLGLALEDPDAALPARAAPAAGRFDRQPGPVGRVEQGRPAGHANGLAAREVGDLDLRARAGTSSDGTPPPAPRGDRGSTRRRTRRGRASRSAAKDRLLHRAVQRVRDRGVHAGADHQREERGVDLVAARHAEARCWRRRRTGSRRARRGSAGSCGAWRCRRRVPRRSASRADR